MRAAEEAHSPLLLRGISSGSVVAAAASPGECSRERQQLHAACDSRAAREQQWQEQGHRQIQQQQEKTADMEAVPSQPAPPEAAAAACRTAAPAAGAAAASFEALGDAAWQSSAPPAVSSAAAAASRDGAPPAASMNFRRVAAGPASVTVRAVAKGEASCTAPAAAGEKTGRLREQTEETCVDGDGASVVAGDGDSEDGGRELPCFCASFVPPYFFSPSCSAGTPPPLRPTSRARGSSSSSSESSSKSGSEDTSSSSRSRGSLGGNSTDPAAASEVCSNSERRSHSWGRAAGATAAGAALDVSDDRNADEHSSSSGPGGVTSAAARQTADQQQQSGVASLKDSSSSSNSTGSSSACSSAGSPSSSSASRSSSPSRPRSRSSSSSSCATSAVTDCRDIAMDVDFPPAADAGGETASPRGGDAAAVSLAATEKALAADAAAAKAAAAEATATAGADGGAVAVNGATAAAASGAPGTQGLEAAGPTAGGRRGEGGCSQLVDAGVDARTRGGGACSSVEELAALFEPLPTDDLLLESSAATAALTATTLLPASAFLQTELLAGTTMSLPLIVSFLFSLFNGDPKLGLLTPQAKYMAWRSLLFLSDLHDGKVAPTDVLGEAAAFPATSAASTGAGNGSTNGKSARFRLPHPHFTRGVQQQLQQMQQQQSSAGGAAADRAGGGGAAGIAVAGASGVLHPQQHMAVASAAGESVATSKGKRTVKHAFLSERYQPSSMQEKGGLAGLAGATADGGGLATAGGVADGRGDSAYSAAGAAAGGGGRGAAVSFSSGSNSSSSTSPVRTTCTASLKTARATAGSSSGDGGGQQQQQQQSATAAGTRRTAGKDDSSDGAAAASAAGGSARGSVSPPSTRNTQRLHVSGGGGTDAVAGAGGVGQGEEERREGTAEGGAAQSRTAAPVEAPSGLQQKQHAAALGEQQVVGYEENFPRFVCGSIDRRWALQQRTVTIYRDEEKSSTGTAGTGGAGGGAGAGGAGGQGTSSNAQQQLQSQQQRSKAKTREEQEKKAAEVDEEGKVDAGPLELQFEEIRYSAALHMWPRKTLVPVLPEKISQGLAVQVACTAKVVDRGSSSSPGTGEIRVVWRDGEVTKVLQATGDVYVRMQSNHRDFKSVKCSIRDFLHPRVPVTRLRERLWRLRPHIADVATDIYPGACLCISVAGPSLSSGAPSATAASTSSANRSGTSHLATALDGGRTPPVSGSGGAQGATAAGGPTGGAADAAAGDTFEGGGSGGEPAASGQRGEGGAAAAGEEIGALAGSVARSGSIFFVDTVVHQVFFSAEEARESRRRCLAARCNKTASISSSSNNSASSSSKTDMHASRRSSGSREELGRGSRRSSPEPEYDVQQQSKDGLCGSARDGNSSSTCKRTECHVAAAPLEHDEADHAAAEGAAEGAAAAAAVATVGQGMRPGRQQRFQLRSLTQRETGGGGGGKQTGSGKQQQQQQGSSKQQRWRQMQHQQPSAWVQQSPQPGKKPLRQIPKEKDDDELVSTADADEVPPDALIHPLEGLRPDKPVVEVHVLLLGGSSGSTGSIQLVEDVIRLSGRRVYKLAYDLHAHFNEKVSVIAPRDSSCPPLPRSLALRSSSSSCTVISSSSSDSSGASARRGAPGSNSSETTASWGGGEEAPVRAKPPGVFPSAQRQAEAFIWVVPRALSHEAAFTAKGRNRGLASEYHFSHYYYSQQQHQQQQRQQLHLQQKQREQQLLQQGQKQTAAAGGGSAAALRGSNSEPLRSGGTAAPASGSAATALPQSVSTGLPAVAAAAASPGGEPSSSSSSGEDPRTELRTGGGAGVQQGGAAAAASAGGEEGGSARCAGRSSVGSVRGSSSRSSSGMRSALYTGAGGVQQHSGECAGPFAAAGSLCGSTGAVSAGAAAGGAGTSSSAAAAAAGAGFGLSGGTPQLLPNVSRWESRTRDRAKDWVDYPPFVLCCFRFHPDTRFYHRHSQLLRYLQPELDFLALQRGVWKLKLPLLTEASFCCGASLVPPSLLSAAAVPAICSASPSSLHVSSLLLHPSDPALPRQYAAAAHSDRESACSAVNARCATDEAPVAAKRLPLVKGDEAAAEAAAATVEAVDAAAAETPAAAGTAGTAIASEKGVANHYVQRQPLQLQRRQQKQIVQGSRKASGSGAESPVGDRSRRGSCCRDWSSGSEVRMKNVNESQTTAAEYDERRQSTKIVAAAAAECEEDNEMPQFDGQKDSTDARCSSSPLRTSSDTAGAAFADRQTGAVATETTAVTASRIATEGGQGTEVEEGEEGLRLLVRQVQATGQQQQPQQCKRPRGNDLEDSMEAQPEVLPPGGLPSACRSGTSSSTEEVCSDAPSGATSLRNTFGARGATSVLGDAAASSSASRWDTFERLWTAAAQREANCGATAAGGKVTTGAGPRGRPWTLKEARERLWRVWVEEGRRRRQHLLRDPSLGRAEDAAEEEALLCSSSSSEQQQHAVCHTQEASGQFRPLQEQDEALHSGRQDAGVVSDGWGTQRQQSLATTAEVGSARSLRGDEGREFEEDDEVEEPTYGACKRRRDQFGAAVPAAPAPHSTPPSALRFVRDHAPLWDGGDAETFQSSTVAAAASRQQAQQGPARRDVHRGLCSSGDDVSDAARTRAAGGAAAGARGVAARADASSEELFARDPWLIPCTGSRHANGDGQQLRGRGETQGLQQKQVDGKMREASGELWSAAAEQRPTSEPAAGGEGEEAGGERQTPADEGEARPTATDSETSRRRSLMYDVVHFLAQRAGLTGRSWRPAEEEQQGELQQRWGSGQQPQHQLQQQRNGEQEAVQEQRLQRLMSHSGEQLLRGREQGPGNTAGLARERELLGVEEEAAVEYAEDGRNQYIPGESGQLGLAPEQLLLRALQRQRQQLLQQHDQTAKESINSGTAGLHRRKSGAGLAAANRSSVRSSVRTTKTAGGAFVSAGSSRRGSAAVSVTHEEYMAADRGATHEGEHHVEDDPASSEAQRQQRRSAQLLLLQLLQQLRSRGGISGGARDLSAAAATLLRSRCLEKTKEEPSVAACDGETAIEEHMHRVSATDTGDARCSESDAVALASFQTLDHREVQQQHRQQPPRPSEQRARQQQLLLEQEVDPTPAQQPWHRGGETGLTLTAAALLLGREERNTALLSHFKRLMDGRGRATAGGSASPAGNLVDADLLVRGGVHSGPCNRHYGELLTVATSRRGSLQETEAYPTGRETCVTGGVGAATRGDSSGSTLLGGAASSASGIGPAPAAGVHADHPQWWAAPRANTGGAEGSHNVREGDCDVCSNDSAAGTYQEQPPQQQTGSQLRQRLLRRRRSSTDGSTRGNSSFAMSIAAAAPAAGKGQILRGTQKQACACGEEEGQASTERTAVQADERALFNGRHVCHYEPQPRPHEHLTYSEGRGVQEQRMPKDEDDLNSDVEGEAVAARAVTRPERTTASTFTASAAVTPSTATAAATPSTATAAGTPPVGLVVSAPAPAGHASSAHNVHHQQHNVRRRRTCFEVLPGEERGISPRETERSDSPTAPPEAAASGEKGLQHAPKLCSISRVKCEGFSFSHGSGTGAAASGPLYLSSNVAPAAAAGTLPSSPAVAATTYGVATHASSACTFVADPTVAAASDCVNAPQSAAARQSASASHSAGAVSRAPNPCAAGSARFPLCSSSSSPRASCVSSVAGEDGSAGAARRSTPAIPARRDTSNRAASGTSSWKGSSSVSDSAEAAASSRKEESGCQRKGHPRSAAAAAAEQLRNLAAAADALPASVADAVHDYSCRSPPPLVPPRRVHPPVRTPLQQPQQVTAGDRSGDGRKQQRRQLRRGAEGDDEDDGHAASKEEEEEDVELPTRQISRQYTTVTHTAAATTSPAVLGAATSHRSRRRSYERTAADLDRKSSRGRDEEVEEEGADCKAQGAVMPEAVAAAAGGDRRAPPGPGRRSAAAKATDSSVSKGQYAEEETDNGATGQTRANAYAVYLERAKALHHRGSTADSQSEEAAYTAYVESAGEDADAAGRTPRHAVERGAAGAAGEAAGRAAAAATGGDQGATGDLGDDGSTPGAGSKTAEPRGGTVGGTRRAAKSFQRETRRPEAVSVGNAAIDGGDVGDMPAARFRGQTQPGRGAAAKGEEETQSGAVVGGAREGHIGRRSSTDAAAGQGSAGRTTVCGGQSGRDAAALVTRRRSEQQKFGADAFLPASCASPAAQFPERSCRRGSSTSSNRESSRESSCHSGIGNSRARRSSNTSRCGENSNGVRGEKSRSSSSQVSSTGGRMRAGSSCFIGRTGSSCSKRRNPRSSGGSGRVDDLWEPADCSSGSGSEGNSSRYAVVVRRWNRHPTMRSAGGTCSNRSSSENHAAGATEGDEDESPIRGGRPAAACAAAASSAGSLSTAAASGYDGLQLRSRALADYATAADSKRAKESPRLSAPRMVADVGTTRLQERVGTHHLRQGTSSATHSAAAAATKGKEAVSSISDSSSTTQQTTGGAARRSAEATSGSGEAARVAAAVKKLPGDRAAATRPPSSPALAAAAHPCTRSTGPALLIHCSVPTLGAGATAAVGGGAVLRSPLAGPYSTRQRAVTPLLLPAGRAKTSGAGADVSCTTAGTKKGGPVAGSREHADVAPYSEFARGAAASLPAAVAAGGAASEAAEICLADDLPRRATEKNRFSSDRSLEKHVAPPSTVSTGESAQHEATAVASPVGSHPRGTHEQHQQQRQTRGQPGGRFSPVVQQAHWRETRISAGKRHLPEQEAEPERLQQDLDETPAAADAPAGEAEDGDDEDTNVTKSWRKAVGGAVVASHFRRGDGNSAAAASVLQCAAAEKTVQQQEAEQRRRSKRMRRGALYTTKTGAWGRQVLQ